jgi:hypothetical protein
MRSTPQFAQHEVTKGEADNQYNDDEAINSRNDRRPTDRGIADALVGQVSYLTRALVKLET